MFNLTPPGEPTGLDKAIADALSDLEGRDAETKEYAQIIEQLGKLYDMKEKEKKSSFAVDPNTLLMVAGNILGIALITRFEKEHIVTSKALGFIGRFK